jgi:hypothetical protein
MIADPLPTRKANLFANELGADANVNFDLISSGPGSQTVRKAPAATVAGLVLTCAVKHEVTSKGRRRSTVRFDVVAPVNSPFYDELNSVQRSASAYLVIDQHEAGSPKDIALVDAVLSCLLHSLVGTRESGDTMVTGAILGDFVNGEP